MSLIGPLQSNKVAEAVGFFDVIETIDRDKIARAVADEIQKQGRAPRLLVQVNIGEEAQKSGVMPAETDTFLQACTGYGLKIEGLMCIPPVEGSRGALLRPAEKDRRPS
ncbi:MAG: alanine racemase [Asticcacaulis sp.]